MSDIPGVPGGIIIDVVMAVAMAACFLLIFQKAIGWFERCQSLPKKGVAIAFGMVAMAGSILIVTALWL